MKEVMKMGLRDWEEEMRKLREEMREGLEKVERSEGRRSKMKRRDKSNVGAD